MTKGFPKEAREAARERCEKATEGEWLNPFEQDDEDANAFIAVDGTEVVWPDWYDGPRLGVYENDAEFIACARTDLPRALDHIDTLEERIGELTEELSILELFSEQEGKQQRAHRIRLLLNKPLGNQKEEE